MVKKGEKIVVWFSCGAASAVAAKKTIEKYGHLATIRVVNNPIAEEHYDNRRFLSDVEDWLGVKIETVTNPNYPAASCYSVWERRKFMSGPKGAPCTIELKKKARQYFETHTDIDWHVLGFTADEKKRSDRFILGERSNLLPVLIDEGLTKQDCMRIIERAGIPAPEVYRLDFPNANCIGCVKATSPTYWNHVRQHFPDIFNLRALQSRKLGAKLVRVKGVRIFLDRLDPDAVGAPLKSMNFECGIFCEEHA